MEILHSQSFFIILNDSLHKFLKNSSKGAKHLDAQQHFLS